jgi:hypothetical protein
MLIVSPGIKPGYIAFPSKKKIMYSFVWHAAIGYTVKLKKFLAMRRF